MPPLVRSRRSPVGVRRLRLGQDRVDPGEVGAELRVLLAQRLVLGLEDRVGGQRVPTLIEEVDGKLLFGCHAAVPVSGRI